MFPPKTTSTEGRNFPEFDGWRGLAILSVLLSHFVGGEYFGWMGNFGVQLFFVLSGYFMSNLLFIRRMSLQTFFIRRFSRVYPAFFLATLAFYVWAAKIQPISYSVPFDELISTLFFFRTYYPGDVSIWQSDWPIGHYWSLNVEEHSYVYMALGLLLIRQFECKLVTIVFLMTSTAGTIFCMYFYGKSVPSVGSHWSLYSQCAAIGILASATCRILVHDYGPSWLSISPLISVLTFGAAVMVSAPIGLFSSSTLAVLLLAISVNHLVTAPAFVKWLLSLRLLRWFGVYSFSLYLWQQPFFLLATEKTLYWPLLAIACGITSYLCIEKPVRSFINSRWAAI